MALKIFYATFIYRNQNGELRQARKDIQSTSLKDAKKTAKNIAEQNDWRLLDIITGGR